MDVVLLDVVVVDVLELDVVVLDELLVDELLVDAQRVVDGPGRLELLVMELILRRHARGADGRACRASARSSA